MQAKAFQTTIWDGIHSTLWEQQKKWVPTCFKGCHKCNESPQELQDGGGPNWCAMPRKKSWTLDEKVEQLHEQKAKQPTPCPHKTSSVYNVNHKSCQI